MLDAARTASGAAGVRIDGAHDPAVARSAPARTSRNCDGRPGKDTDILDPPPCVRAGDRRLCRCRRATACAAAGTARPPTRRCTARWPRPPTRDRRPESFIIEDDEVGQRFATELKAAQARGVVVNLIYDGVGSLGTPMATATSTSSPPHGINSAGVQPGRPAQGARTGWDVNQRDHRKLDDRSDGKDGLRRRHQHQQRLPRAPRSASIRRISRGDEPEGALALDTDLQIDGPDSGRLPEAVHRRPGRARRASPWPAPTGFPQISRQERRGGVRAIGRHARRAVQRQIYATLVSAILQLVDISILLANAYFDPDPQLLGRARRCGQSAASTCNCCPA